MRRDGPARSRLEAGLQLAVVFLLTVAGAWLRYLEAGGKALWRDETQLLAVARLTTVRELVSFLALHESHPPLYALLTRTWSSVFGWTDSAVVILPVLCGVAAVPVAWLVGRDWAGVRAGLMAAAITAVLPSAVFFGGQVRPYAFLGTMVLVATWLFARTMRDRSAGLRAAYVVAAAVLVYTHNWMWLVLGGHGIVWVVARCRGLGMGLTPREAVGLSAAVLAAYSAWLPALLRQSMTAGHFRYEATLLDGVEHAVGWVLGTPIGTSLAGLTALLLLRRRRTAKGSEWHAHEPVAELLVVGLPVLAAALAVLLYPVADLLVAGGFATLGPLAAVGLAILISGTARVGVRTSLAWRGLVWLAGTAGLAGLTWVAWVRGPTPKTNAKEVATLIEREGVATDLIILVDVYASPSVLWYLPESRWGRLITFPEERATLPIAFDDRIPQDMRSAPASLERIRSEVQETYRSGGRVWYLEHALVVPHLREYTRTLRSVLREVYGGEGTNRTVGQPAWLEWFSVILFSP